MLEGLFFFVVGLIFVSLFSKKGRSSVGGLLKFILGTFGIILAGILAIGLIIAILWILGVGVPAVFGCFDSESFFSCWWTAFLDLPPT